MLLKPEIILTRICQVIRLYQWTEKAMEDKNDSDTNYNWSTGNDPKNVEKKRRQECNRWKSRQWPGRPNFNPRSRHTKDFKSGTWYLHA